MIGILKNLTRDNRKQISVGSSIGKIASIANPVAAVGTAVGAGGLDFLAAKSLQGDAQSFSAREAARAREFSEYMYKNRFQMSVKDMRKAGINPILAASMGLGGGATVGTSAGPGAGLSQTRPGTSAVQAMRAANEIKTLQATQYQQTKLGELHGQQAQESEARTALTAAETLIKTLQVPQATSAANFYSSTQGPVATAFQEYGKGGMPGQVGGVIYGIGRLFQAARSNKAIMAQLEKLYRDFPILKKIIPLFPKAR